MYNHYFRSFWMESLKKSVKVGDVQSTTSGTKNVLSKKSYSMMLVEKTLNFLCETRQKRVVKYISFNFFNMGSKMNKHGCRVWRPRWYISTSLLKLSLSAPPPPTGVLRANKIVKYQQQHGFPIWLPPHYTTAFWSIHVLLLKNWRIQNIDPQSMDPFVDPVHGLSLWTTPYF